MQLGKEKPSNYYTYPFIVDYFRSRELHTDQERERSTVKIGFDEESIN